MEWLNCTTAVSAPIDAAPIRSPQQTHTAIARRIGGQDLVEIGTRNGDGMMCLARVARRAVAIEYNPKYCRKLRERRRRAHLNYTVVCSDFRAAPLDADMITWWQQGGLSNEAALAVLHEQQRAGHVRPTAEAALLFDTSWAHDMASFRSLCGLASWMESIPFDERALCRTKLKGGGHHHDDSETCSRARGTFFVVGVPVSRVGAVPRAGWGVCGLTAASVAWPTWRPPAWWYSLGALAATLLTGVCVCRVGRRAHGAQARLAILGSLAAATDASRPDATRSDATRPAASWMVPVVSRASSPPRVAICYFGLTRSIRVGTHKSHHRHLFDVLAAAGLEYRTFMHTWDVPGGIQRVWYASVGTPIDYDEPTLLAPHAFRRDNQSDFERALRERDAPFAAVLVNASWDRTLVANTLCELESIRRVHAMARASAFAYTHLVFVRPDVLLLNDLPILPILSLGAGCVALPRWGFNRGYNDQFAAMRRGAAASAWADRIHDVPALSQVGAHWEAETLVKYSLRLNRVKAHFVDFFFVRLRPNGALHVSVDMESVLASDIKKQRANLIRRGFGAAAAAPTAPTPVGEGAHCAARPLTLAMGVGLLAMGFAGGRASAVGRTPVVKYPFEFFSTYVDLYGR